MLCRRTALQSWMLMRPPSCWGQPIRAQWPNVRDCVDCVDCGCVSLMQLALVGLCHLWSGLWMRYLISCDNLWQSVTISCQCCANFIQFPISDVTFCVPRGVCQRNLPQSPWSKSWKSSCRQVTATERSELDWSRIFSPNTVLKNDGNVTIFFLTQQQQNATDSKGFRVILSSPEAIPESCQPCHRSIQFRVRAAWQAQAPQFGSCFRELHRSRKREVSRQRLGSSGLSQCLGENSRRKSYCSTIVFVFVCMISFCVFIDLSYQLCLRGWC